MQNTLAYSGAEFITAVNFFYSADPSANLIQLFSQSLLLGQNKLVCMFLARLLQCRINYVCKSFYSADPSANLIKPFLLVTVAGSK